MAFCNQVGRVTAKTVMEDSVVPEGEGVPELREQMGIGTIIIVYSCVLNLGGSRVDCIEGRPALGLPGGVDEKVS